LEVLKWIEAHSELAAWVQAVASVIAIVGSVGASIFVTNYQFKKQRLEDSRNRRMQYIEHLCALEQCLLATIAFCNGVQEELKNSPSAELQVFGKLAKRMSYPFLKNHLNSIDVFLWKGSVERVATGVLNEAIHLIEEILNELNDSMDDRQIPDAIFALREICDSLDQNRFAVNKRITSYEL
jgi:hypothetical protein